MSVICFVCSSTFVPKDNYQECKKCLTKNNGFAEIYTKPVIYEKPVEEEKTILNYDDYKVLEKFQFILKCKENEKLVLDYSDFMNEGMELYDKLHLNLYNETNQFGNFENFLRWKCYSDIFGIIKANKLTDEEIYKYILNEGGRYNLIYNNSKNKMKSVLKKNNI